MLHCLPGVSLAKAMEINQLAAQNMKSLTNWILLFPKPDKQVLHLIQEVLIKLDMLVYLNPKSEWKRDITREELTNEMREAT